MKNLKKLLFLFVFIFLLLGITNNVYAKDNKLNIEKVEILDKSTTIEVDEPILEGNTISSNIIFNKIDDYVVFNLTLKNNSDAKYKVNSFKNNNKNENITIDTNYDQEYIESGKTINLTIKVVYSKKLINVDSIDISDLSISVDLVNENGDADSIVINPPTGDNIYMYILIFILLVVGLIFINKTVKIKNVKIGGFILILAIVLIPFAAFAVDEFKINFKFKTIKIVGEFEKYNIRYDLNEGSLPIGDIVNEDIIIDENGNKYIDVIVTYGSKLGTLPDTPVKDGYTFVKWVDENGKEVNENTIVTGPIKIDAEYKINKYKISYELNGGKVDNPKEYTVEDEIVLNNPTKKGYTFSGWTGSNNDELQTRVTINKGTTGDLEFKANYSTNTDTPYKVIHKYQNLDLETYSEVVENLTGATDTKVEPALLVRSGYDNPELQELIISGEGDSTVTYIYNRSKYTFTIEDRTYVYNTTTVNGTYPYGTVIELNAQTRAGYDFKWSDENTNYNRTFNIERNVNITPVYTARTDTQYQIIHKKEQLNGSYEIAEIENKTGTTDTTINPNVKTYPGFTSPSVKEVIINGNGNTKVEYLYRRNKYNLVIEDANYVVNDKSGEYYFEEEISLKAIERPGYTFIGWSNGEDTNEITLSMIVDGITIKPLYTANTNTAYQVIHKQEQLNGSYLTVETENKTGTTDTTVSPSVNTYPGFSSPSVKEAVIDGNGNTKVEYLYTRNKYSLVIEDANYVEVDKSGEYYFEEEISLKAKERPGYTFSGWSNGEETQTITLSMVVDGITIKPLYTTNTDTVYKVIHKYRNLDNTFLEDEVSDTGTTDTTVPASLKPKTGFISPSVQNVTIKGDGTGSVTYIYEREEYSFSISDRTYLDNTSTANGNYLYETVITLKAKTRDGYTFKWSDNNTNLERTITLTANTELSLVYTPKTDTVYKVIHKYRNLDNTFIEDEVSDTGTTDTTVPASLKPKTGFISPNVQNVTIKGDGTGSVTYIYEREEYSFSISDRTYLDNTSTTNGNYLYESVITLKALNREGYTFKWSDNNTDLERTITLTSNTELSLIYTPNTYEVVFNGNDPDVVGEMNNQSFTYDIEKALSPNSYSLAKYKFDGWNTQADGNGTTYSDGALVSNLATSGVVNLYAMWSLNVYTVTFNSQGGNSIDPIEIEKGLSIETLPTPTRDDYDFSGWYTGITDGILVSDGYTPTEDTLLYAHWTEKPKSFVCKLATSLHTEECTRTSAGCFAAGYTLTGSKGTNIITYGNISSSNNYMAGDAYDCDVDGNGIFDSDNERFYYVRNNGANEVLVYYTNYEGSNGAKNENIFSYTDALTKLPTLEQWSNIDVTFDGRAARLPKYADFESVCSLPLTDTGSIDSCVFFVENTRYHSNSLGRTAIWLELEDDLYRRIHTSDRKMGTVTNSSNNVARPVIEVPTELVEKNNNVIKKVTVTFDTLGGNQIAPREVSKGANIGSLPVAERIGYTFDGWYTDNTYTTIVLSSTIITSDTTFVAKWTEREEVALIGTKYYTSVQSAVNAVTKDGVKTTIILTKDLTLPSTISINGTDDNLKNIVLDLNNHTLIYNDGNVIKSKATLEIKNGTIQTSAGSGAVDNNGGTLIMNSGSIIATGSRQAIYNNGGTVEIGGTAYLESSAAEEKRGTVHNVTGTLKITGGTIVSKTFNGVKVDAGTIIIGEENNNYNVSSPDISGPAYGISTTQNIKIYDGIIKGGTNAINDESKIIDTEDGAIKVVNRDPNTNIESLYYDFTPSQYIITFNPNGGTVSPTSKNVDVGSKLNELPTPTRGSYVFDGWYTGLTDGVLVDEDTIPDSDITYYARWHFESNEDIVSFNILNDAIKDYYSSISDWASDEDTFQTNMDTNFNKYNCSECTGPNYQDCGIPSAGTVLCDQPKGYNTGITDEIKVYLSNTSKEHKDEVSYVTVDNGVIYNMIPGEIYYYESVEDANAHGYVKAVGNRRIISSNVRNVRDLGGFEVDYNNDGVIDGTVKYGRLFRGAKLSGSSSDVSELLKLGITEELDLRGSSTDARLSNYKGISITNYLINYDTYASNYAVFRESLVNAMQDIINGENIYFHCKIGTDRTGTLAYFLEGLLGVSFEDRLEDYELSYFYGLLNRHRFHDYLDVSSINPRFKTMYTTYQTTQSIYEYFMAGSQNVESDKKLIDDFRNAMINPR